MKRIAHHFSIRLSHAITLAVLACASICQDISAEYTPALIPFNSSDFIIDPGQASVLRWNISTPEKNIDYTISDYCGNVISNGHVEPDASNTIQLQVQLARGFYEIHFNGLNQDFGLISLEKQNAKPDLFWGIDMAMSWLEKSDDLRSAAITNLARHKIPMIRERLGWSALQPAVGQWQWNGGSRYESLRMAYADAGIGVMEMFHDSPSWMGASVRNSYPSDLAKASQAWVTITQRWSRAIKQLEIWNEPDTDVFSGNLPPDQLASLYAAIDYQRHKNNIQLPIIMAGLTASVLDRKSEYLHLLMQCGILDHVDAMAFHDHGEAALLTAQVMTYRKILAEQNHPNMPLINSESGRAWRDKLDGQTTRSDRPVWEQAVYVAQETVMKAIESRAAGVAQFYAFVYPFYQENKGNWGLVGREGTPTHALSAYFNAMQILANTHYLERVMHFCLDVR